MKVLVINPGATSTKVAVFDEETQVYKTTVDHSPQELDRFDRVIDQADYRQQAILEANAADLEAARGHISEVMLDRLALTPERISSMSKGIREVADLPDPVGRVLRRVERPNGLVIEKTAVPMGVIAII